MRVILHFTLFLLLLPTAVIAHTAGGWRASCLEAGKDGAVVLLRSGGTLSGEITRITQDSLALGVRQPADGRTLPVTPVVVPLNEVSEITCGDGVWNGALTGFLIGSAIGTTVFTILFWPESHAESNEAWYGIPTGIVGVGIPMAGLGALLDAARGGFLKRYVIRDVPVTKEPSP